MDKHNFTPFHAMMVTMYERRLAALDLKGHTFIGISKKELTDLVAVMKDMRDIIESIPGCEHDVNWKFEKGAVVNFCTKCGERIE